jgi:hypothetical protein
MDKFYLLIYIEWLPELLGKDFMRARLILNQDMVWWDKKGRRKEIS